MRVKALTVRAQAEDGFGFKFKISLCHGI
ncbi:Protein of unknown function [Pyronema omphalodes CBS 100304]|uniref:Uncharacterized protein n=1 Tax=Pyronema omphalodes (strain CBS 100304) TaxID=1076935 RepID=U4LCL6_PYROM|nr:Protein of unknown function [Pyronema omphalodes CBS 100304]